MVQAAIWAAQSEPREEGHTNATTNTICFRGGAQTSAWGAPSEISGAMNFLRQFNGPNHVWPRTVPPPPPPPKKIAGLFVACGVGHTHPPGLCRPDSERGEQCFRRPDADPSGPRWGCEGAVWLGVSAEFHFNNSASVEGGGGLVPDHPPSLPPSSDPPPPPRSPPPRFCDWAKICSAPLPNLKFSLTPLAPPQPQHHRRRGKGLDPPPPPPFSVELWVSVRQTCRSVSQSPAPPPPTGGRACGPNALFLPPNDHTNGRHSNHQPPPAVFLTAPAIPRLGALSFHCVPNLQV